MAYVAGLAVFSTLEEAQLYLQQELTKISDESRLPRVEGLLLSVLHTEPEKVEDGLLVEADGTDWNPGAGAGLYIRRAGAWVRIG